MNSSRPASPAILYRAQFQHGPGCFQNTLQRRPVQRALHLKMDPGLTGDPLRAFSQGIINLLTSDRQLGKYPGLVIGEDQAQGSLNRRSAFPIQPIRDRIGPPLEKNE